MHGLKWPIISTRTVLLAAAVEGGMEALVLGRGMPKSARKFGYCDAEFDVRVPLARCCRRSSPGQDPSTEFKQFTSFDGLVKHADSFQLDEIIGICACAKSRSGSKRKSSIYTVGVRIRDFGNQPGDYPGKQRQQAAKEPRNNARM